METKVNEIFEYRKYRFLITFFIINVKQSYLKTISEYTIKILKNNKILNIRK